MTKLPTAFHRVRLLSIAVAFALSSEAASAQQVWKQSLELQPSIERGAAVEPARQELPGVSDADFNKARPIPRWIWGADNNKNYVLQKRFMLPQVKAARLMASCDNNGTVFVNGKQVASGAEWSEAMNVDVTKQLVEGENLVEARVSNEGGVAAFVLKLVAVDSGGNTVTVTTDTTWTVASAPGVAPSGNAELRGTLGDGPWNNVFANPVSAGRVPAGTFEVLPGFQVEKLFTVPKDELGSWVCIAFDNKGRLLASDQGDKGLCRITVPKSVAGNVDASASEAVIERLDFSGCEFQPTGAHGMLWAFDSLYICINGGPGSGLYRARDKDGDDKFDECVRLKTFGGGGEHGPHSLRLSPDGKRIFVIAGNHTQPPFKAGEDLENDKYSSHIPTNWGEDLLLPRMWDANGHARGVLAPGGWIASTDPDGITWDIWSIGYRNPYDMAFNADGELFAYDADMEWDVGAPWYRPTRVVHATSGSEFGWRSGTGKWPVNYADSLPPLVNIGPGSPVGVDFGYGLKFPAKYQKALFICDWTFGTMYAIHITPNQSSYTAVKEEFVSRTPLPLTDVAAGPDGNLYFTIGGRGTQSELFRVSYVGTQSTAPAVLHDAAFAQQRAHRHDLEKFHGKATQLKAALPPESNNFFATAKADIATGDRFLKTASRNAFFNSHLLWQLLNSETLRQADVSQSTPDEVLAIVIAFARAPLAQVAAARGLGESDAQEWQQVTQTVMLEALQQLDFGSLNTEQKLDYVRALSLLFIRFGPPDEATADRFATKLDPHFPAKKNDLDRELCQMLVYLNSTSVVSRTVALMKMDSVPEDIDMTDLLARNSGYGRAINDMIANQPDQQQTWYAFCLRVARVGWTPDTRADYFRWFAKSQNWSGGNSFRKFLQNIENEAYDTTNENERVLLEATGARTPFKVAELPKPEGPGKAWQLAEVRNLAADGLKGRDFDRGQKMFAATRCIICHRFAGDGGATGPDLTQLAGRFNLNDLTEALMDPSKVISDQYKASTVVTTAGAMISGRIISENEDQISVLTDPEDSTRVVDIAKADIDEIVASKTSLMPSDLLKPLNQDEVLDLLAYLLSRGDKGHPMFRK